MAGVAVYISEYGRRWDRRVDLVDTERDRGREHADGQFGIALREPGDVHGDRDGGGGGDDRGEQSHQSVGYRGDGGRLAAVGDREGCQWEPGGQRRGDVHPGGGKRDGDADDTRKYGRRWDRYVDLMDTERDRGREHGDGQFGIPVREPGDLHGGRDGGGGDAARAYDGAVEQCAERGRVRPAAGGPAPGREWQRGER